MQSGKGAIHQPSTCIIGDFRALFEIKKHHQNREGAHTADSSKKMVPFREKG
jgi:hypothetical protein